MTRHRTTGAHRARALLSLVPGVGALCVGALCVGALDADGAPAMAAEGDRVTELTIDIRVDTADGGALDLWVPLPAEELHQHVDALDVDASIPGSVQIEPRHGNRVWHGHADAIEGTVTVRVTARVRREAVRGPTAQPAPTAGERAVLLEANRLVPVDGPLVERLRAELPARHGPDSTRARDIFEYVLDHIEYKKVGDGWGRGSTEWACSAKYGNCTDFHALYTSLSRAEGLPTRFHIGYPLPEGQPQGEIGGYHCWLDVWTDDQGWLSVDASEAWKDREHADRYFSSLPADRVGFTVGRDLRLGQQGPPLNFLVHPYAELDGVPLDAIDTRVRYRDL